MTHQDSQQVAQFQTAIFPQSNWIRAGISLADDGPMSWVGHDLAEVAGNRERYFAQAGIDAARVVSAEQVHGTEVYVIPEMDAGRGALHPRDRIARTDGFVTNVQGLVLTTLHADCAPIFYADQERRAIGLAHAGRRGILAGLGGKMLAVMAKEFGSDKRQITVVVGPTVCPDHYEVTTELAEDFQQRFGERVVSWSDGRPNLDLWKALTADLLEHGLSPDRIPNRPPCTYSNPQYPSYRRDGPPARSMLAWLEIR